MKESRRVQLTKKLIKDAFVNLLSEKNINKVTVKEICENADINRSTFYAHYTDQYGLFEELQEDIIAITPGISLYEKENIYSFLTDFFKYIDKNKKIYKVLFENSRGMYFRNRILNKVFSRDDTNIEWIDGEMNLGDNMDFKMLMCAFGGMTMIEKWIFGEFEETAENLATYMTNFFEKV